MAAKINITNIILSNRRQLLRGILLEQNKVRGSTQRQGLYNIENIYYRDSTLYKQPVTRITSITLTELHGLYKIYWGNKT